MSIFATITKNAVNSVVCHCFSAMTPFTQCLPVTLIPNCSFTSFPSFWYDTHNGCAFRKISAWLFSIGCTLVKDSGDSTGDFSDSTVTVVRMNCHLRKPCAFKELHTVGDRSDSNHNFILILLLYTQLLYYFSIS